MTHVAFIERALTRLYEDGVHTRTPAGQTTPGRLLAALLGGSEELYQCCIERAPLFRALDPDMPRSVTSIAQSLPFKAPAAPASPPQSCDSLFWMLVALAIALFVTTALHRRCACLQAYRCMYV